MGAGASRVPPPPGSQNNPEEQGLLEKITYARRAQKNPHKSGLLLPVDMLGRVFLSRHLEGCRVPLSGVCRTWDGIVAGIVRKITVRQPRKHLRDVGAPSKLLPSNILGTLVRFEHLQQLTLQDGGGPGRCSIDPTVWAHLPTPISMLMQLRELSIISCGVDDANLLPLIQAAAGSMKQSKCALQRLVIEDCELVTSKSIGEAGSSLERVSTLALRQLKLSSTQVKSCISNYKTLESLELSGIETLSTKVIGAEFSGLRCVDLSCNAWVDDRTLVSLSQHCKDHLRELTLRRCEQITGTGVSKLSVLKNLKLVDLSWCTQVDGDSLNILPGGIVHLVLEGCKKIDNKALMDISASKPHLTHLSVANCPRVLDMGIAAIGHTNPNPNPNLNLNASPNPNPNPNTNPGHVSNPNASVSQLIVES